MDKAEWDRQMWETGQYPPLTYEQWVRAQTEGPMELPKSMSKAEYDRRIKEGLERVDAALRKRWPPDGWPPFFRVRMKEFCEEMDVRKQRKEKPLSFLDKVAKVRRERQENYEHPKENFEKIAAKWSITLGGTVTPEQVGIMMIDLKTVRFCHTPDHDHLIDIAGYADCLDAIAKSGPEGPDQATEPCVWDPTNDDKLDADMRAAHLMQKKGRPLVDESEDIPLPPLFERGRADSM